MKSSTTLRKKIERAMAPIFNLYYFQRFAKSASALEPSSYRLSISAGFFPNLPAMPPPPRRSNIADFFTVKSNEKKNGHHIPLEPFVPKCLFFHGCLHLDAMAS